MNLTRGQILAIIIATLGVLTASATQLNELVGPTITKLVIAGSNLSMSILSGWMAILFNQGSQLEAVRSMEGVERIVVNEKANGTLATMTVDPTETKLEALPTAQTAVEATARAVS